MLISTTQEIILSPHIIVPCEQLDHILVPARRIDFIKLDEALNFEQFCWALQYPFQAFNFVAL